MLRDFPFSANAVLTLRICLYRWQDIFEPNFQKERKQNSKYSYVHPPTNPKRDKFFRGRIKKNHLMREMMEKLIYLSCHLKSVLTEYACLNPVKDLRMWRFSSLRRHTHAALEVYSITFPPVRQQTASGSHWENMSFGSLPCDPREVLFGLLSVFLMQHIWFPRLWYSTRNRSPHQAFSNTPVITRKSSLAKWGHAVTGSI